MNVIENNLPVWGVQTGRRNLMEKFTDLLVCCPNDLFSQSGFNIKSNLVWTEKPVADVIS